MSSEASFSRDTYRLVGIRADGSRAVLGEQLSYARADSQRNCLNRAHAFPEVLVEREESADLAVAATNGAVGRPPAA